jgi:hypothetical protein
MKLSILISIAAAAVASAAPVTIPAEFLQAIADGTAGKACTPVCVPAGVSTQCYCF